MDRTANLAGAAAVAIVDIIERATDPLIEDRFPPAVFVHLSHCDDPTIESLRRVVGLSHSATVRLVDRLAAENLVARAETEKDRRAVALRLTAQGAEMSERILLARARTLETMLDEALTGEQREALELLLDRLLASLTKRPDDLYRICRMCDFDACPSCPVARAIK